MLLSNFENQLTDAELQVSTNDFFDECVRALETLKKQLPPDINENFIMIFDISDYEDSDQLVEWAKRLNDEEKARQFEEVWSRV